MYIHVGTTCNFSSIAIVGDGRMPYKRFRLRIGVELLNKVVTGALA